MTEGQEREQEKIIEWYKAQAKETTDLKRITFHLWKNDDDESGDEYFPNKVERKYRQLQTENISHARRIKELEEKLDDYYNAEDFVLAEEHPHDEVHCGCVVILRVENKRLGEQIKELDGLLGDLYDEASYERAGEWVIEDKDLQKRVNQALKVGLTEGKVKKGGVKPKPSSPKPNVKPIGQKPVKHVLKRPVVYNDRVVGPS